MAEEEKKKPQPPKNLLEVIQQWPLKRKLSFLGVGLLSLVLFGVLIWSARDADYRLLYSNLDPSDAGAVVGWLKENNLSYRIEDNGKSIYMPAENVYEVRLELAASGIPQGGGIGFDDGKGALNGHVGPLFRFGARPGYSRAPASMGRKGWKGIRAEAAARAGALPIAPESRLRGSFSPGKGWIDAPPRLRH